MTFRRPLLIKREDLVRVPDTGMMANLANSRLGQMMGNAYNRAMGRDYQEAPELARTCRPEFDVPETVPQRRQDNNTRCDSAPVISTTRRRSDSA